MSIGELLLAGVELMVLGMGTVFIFLIILIGILKLMSNLAGRLPEEPAVAANAARPPVGHTEANENDLIVVISAAISKFRSMRNNNS